MNFATLQGLTIPEGVVTQIADAAGNVLWKLETNKPVILQVEKLTKTTYAGETTYENENFILIQIFPKTNGTVSVTYGGLTKTITDTSGAESPNAQNVFFGTFNGVSDSVATPDSGILTIEGDYHSFASGIYAESSKISSARAGCITSVIDLGSIKEFADYAFAYCRKMTSIVIPNHITSIPHGCFINCEALTSVLLHNNITTIGDSGFYYCKSLPSISLPSKLESIGNAAFRGCESLNVPIFPEGLVTISDFAFNMDSRSKTAMRNGTIVLPSTLQSIDNDAFCTNEINGEWYYGYLSSVRCLAKNPPVCGDSVFGDIGAGNTPTISVLVGSKNAYENASGWSNYIIVEA